MEFAVIAWYLSLQSKVSFEMTMICFVETLLITNKDLSDYSSALNPIFKRVCIAVGLWIWNTIIFSYPKNANAYR